MLVHIDNVEIVHVSKTDRLLNATSSKGNQLKWFNSNRYVKLNNGDCYEDISEVLVSYFLGFTSIKSYVVYYPCTIIEDGVELGSGCYSYNFVDNESMDITFYKLLKNNGIDVSSPSYDEVRDSLLEITGVDFKSYIDNCLCLDAITFNDDRHFNNFSVLYSNNTYKFAPIYDNGMSCLSDIYTYPLNVDINTNIRKVFAKPFRFDFESQLKEVNVIPILVDYDGFINSVEMHTKSEIRAFEVIKFGLERFKGLAWEEF